MRIRKQRRRLDGAGEQQHAGQAAPVDGPAEDRRHQRGGDEVAADDRARGRERADQRAQVHEQRQRQHADGHARDQRDGQQRGGVGQAQEAAIARRQHVGRPAQAVLPQYRTRTFSGASHSRNCAISVSSGTTRHASGSDTVALEAVVAVVDDDRALAFAERRQQLEQARGVGAAVARQSDAARVPLADRRQVEDPVGDDAQALRLPVVAHARRHLRLDDQQLVFAQQAARLVEDLAVDGDLGGPFAVVERDEGHLAALAGLDAQRGDDARDQRRLAARLQRREPLPDERRELGGEARVRMPGDVEAQRRLLVLQALGFGPLARGDEGEARVLHRVAEQRDLRRRRLGALRLAERDADRGEQRRATGDRWRRRRRPGSAPRRRGGSPAACRRGGRSRRGRGTARPRRARRRSPRSRAAPVPLTPPRP